LRLNFRSKGYVSRQYLWTVKWGSGYTRILPLEVFTQKNFVADFLRLKFATINSSKRPFKSTKTTKRKTLGQTIIPYTDNSVIEKCVLTPLHLGLYNLYAWRLLEETEN